MTWRPALRPLRHQSWQDSSSCQITVVRDTWLFSRSPCREKGWTLGADGWLLWSPTHAAKYAAWMGHPARWVGDADPGFRPPGRTSPVGYFRVLPAGRRDGPGGWLLWSPTHATKCPLRMRRPAVVLSVISKLGGTGNVESSTIRLAAFGTHLESH